MSANAQPSARLSLTGKCVAGIGLVLVFLLLWAKAMTQGMSHDEHQFIAPAVLLAKEGLLPYRDFPIFHMPNMVLIYSVFALFTDYYQLSATAFNAVCAWLVVCLVGACVYRWMTEYRPPIRLLIAAGFVLLLLSSVVFVWTTGRTWNHDFPMLMTLLTFISHLRAARSARRWLWILLSGFFVGLAAGGRISYLPLVAPFGLAILFFRDVTLRQKFALGTLFGAGVALALLPSFYFYWQAPEAFIFDNLKYPRLRLNDPSDVAQKTFTVASKAKFFWKWIARPDWPVFVGFLAVGLPVLVSRLRDWRRVDAEAVLLALLFPFIVQGCVSPTRTHNQHFYSLIPFLILATAYGFSRLRAGTTLARGAGGLFAVLAVAAAVLIAGRYKNLGQAMAFGRWNPVQTHLAGVEMRNEVGGGRVLTYAPVVPLEGGLKIYPVTATGPFAIRTAHHVADVAMRHRLHLLAMDDVEAFLRKNPPDAVFLGAEPPEAERPFVAHVDAHEFRLVKEGRKRKDGGRTGLYVKVE